MLWRFIGLFSGDMSDGDMVEIITEIAAYLFVILFCLSVHEFAHAWAAKRLGDNTAQMRGRLTLDPFKHLDMFGTLLLLLVGFGYAKPVPVQPRFFKNPKKDMAKVAAAGPLSNLLMAVAFSIFSWVAFIINIRTQGDVSGLLVDFFETACYLNLAIMIFNLLPIPPLDGSRILDMFLPLRASIWLDRNEHYFRYGLYALLVISSWLGGGLVSWIAGPLYMGIEFLVGLPFRFLY